MSLSTKHNGNVKVIYIHYNVKPTSRRSVITATLQYMKLSLPASAAIYCINTDVGTTNTQVKKYQHKARKTVLLQGSDDVRKATPV